MLEWRHTAELRLLTAAGRLNDPSCLVVTSEGGREGGLKRGRPEPERAWEPASDPLNWEFSCLSRRYKISCRAGRPMTDKPKVNTDCRGEGGRRGKLYYFLWFWVPSQSIFEVHRFSFKKFKTNANCLNKLSFELLKYMTGRGGWEHWMVLLWNWTKLVILILTTNIFHEFHSAFLSFQICVWGKLHSMFYILFVYLVNL